jgi:hypothetical protein
MVCDEGESPEGRARRRRGPVIVGFVTTGGRRSLRSLRRSHESGSDARSRHFLRTHNSLARNVAGAP